MGSHISLGFGDNLLDKGHVVMDDFFGTLPFEWIRPIASSGRESMGNIAVKLELG